MTRRPQSHREPERQKPSEATTFQTPTMFINMATEIFSMREERTIANAWLECCKAIEKLKGITITPAEVASTLEAHFKNPIG
jgi:hypothetical protein